MLNTNIDLEWYKILSEVVVEVDKILNYNIKVWWNYSSNNDTMTLTLEDRVTRRREELLSLCIEGDGSVLHMYYFNTPKRVYCNILKEEIIKYLSTWQVKAQIRNLTEWYRE